MKPLTHFLCRELQEIVRLWALRNEYITIRIAAGGRDAVESLQKSFGVTSDKDVAHVSSQRQYRYR